MDLSQNLPLSALLLMANSHLIVITHKASTVIAIRLKVSYYILYFSFQLLFLMVFNCLVHERLHYLISFLHVLDFVLFYFIFWFLLYWKFELMHSTHTRDSFVWHSFKDSCDFSPLFFFNEDFIFFFHYAWSNIPGTIRDFSPAFLSSHWFLCKAIPCHGFG